MVQPREHAAFAVEAFGEQGVLREFVGQKLQRDEAVEVRLAGLEDEAHAAAPDEFEDFKLREGGGDAFEGRYLARRRGWNALFRRRGSTEKNTPGTKPLRSLGGNRGVALGTGR